MAGEGTSGQYGEGLIDRIFPLHPPLDDSIASDMDYIRGRFTDLARDVYRFTPNGPDQTLAIRKLHDAMQAAIGNMANNQEGNKTQ